MTCLAVDVELGPWFGSVTDVGRDRARAERRYGPDADEKDVLRACQAGEEAAFEALVERYGDRVFWVAHHVVADPDDARDVSQEAFLRVFRSIDRYEIDKNFYTWLYKVVVNVGIDFLRKKKTSGAAGSVSLDRIGEVEAREAPGVGRLDEADTKARIDRVLAAMPEKYRTILVLRNLEGKNCREIADLLDANHATVRWQLHKARQIFMAIWNGDLHPAELAEEENEHGM